MSINNKNELYNYKYSSRFTSVWLIPIIDAALTAASTTPLRSEMDDSTSWCCKIAKITLRKTSCEVNSKLTRKFDWKCVHYREMSRLILMYTCSFQGRGSFGVKNWDISAPSEWPLPAISSPSSDADSICKFKNYKY